jgi:hypothetical protein
MNAPHKPEHAADLASELPDISARPPFFGTGVVYPALGETEEEREAALQRLFDAGKLGYASDGTKMTRDEMHER